MQKDQDSGKEKAFRETEAQPPLQRNDQDGEPVGKSYTEARRFWKLYLEGTLSADELGRFTKELLKKDSLNAP